MIHAPKGTADIFQYLLSPFRGAAFPIHCYMNFLANVGKGKHISMQALIKICETINCNLFDVKVLAPDAVGIIMEVRFYERASIFL